MTEENKTPSTKSASSSLGVLLSFMSPSSKSQRKGTTSPTHSTSHPPSTSRHIKNQSSPSTSKSLILVAGLLLSSSGVMPPSSILKENSQGVSSRGMSPLRPKRAIRFESCYDEEPIDDQNGLKEESDEEEKDIEEAADEDDSLAEKWFDRLAKMEEEKLIREADSFFSDSSISSTSGVYVIEDELGAVGVWKPAVEENTVLREGLESGDGAIREVAAYALDSTSGSSRAGVPPTVLYKNGSLQRFVKHECDAEDVGTALFDTENIHSIGLLDLRIFNLDRHGGNMLFDKHSNRLIPIDHGLSLPPLNCLSEAEFGWISFRQAKIQFSERTLSYLRDGIDLEADMMTLRGVGIPESSIATMCVSTSVLRHCALEHGMTLHDIANIFVRHDRDTPSVLELAVTEAMSKYEDDNNVSSLQVAKDVVLLVDLHLRRIREKQFVQEFEKGTATANFWKQLGPPVRY